MYLFTGRGVRLEPRKAASLNEPVQELPLCGLLAVPLYTLGKTKLELTAGVDGKVAKFAPLALSRSRGHAILAPVSGRIRGVKQMEHPLLGKVPCALLEPEAAIPSHQTQTPRLEPDDWKGFVEAAKQAGITDEYDGRPLYRKLREWKERPPGLILINALDDDPYVSSGIASLLEEGEAAVKGAEAIAAALGGCEVKAAVYDMPGRGRVRGLPKRIGTAEIIRVMGKYPVLPTLKRRLGGKADVVGVQACAALFRAVSEGKPQTDVVVTVAGDAVKQWKNVRAPVGTPVRYLLEQCGLEEGVSWLVGGGTMDGESIGNLEIPLVAGMRCLLALKTRPWAKRYPCIGCGRCMLACPMHLMPYYIAKLKEQKEFKEAMKYGAGDCIHCGACTAACPSGIELTSIIRTVVKRNQRADWSDEDDD